MKLYVVMVGLPARGKSTLAKRIQLGLEQQKISAAIFNNGELRRVLHGMRSASPDFFNPDNAEARELRRQISLQNMERARAWLDSGGDVAIIDATNGSEEQRATLVATLRDRPILFIECVNNDALLLDASIKRKTRLPEFSCLSPEEALESFRRRLAYYESVYAPLGKERCWMRVDAVSNSILAEAPSNALPYYAAIRDIVVSRWVQHLYLVRHMETEYNLEGRLGGDPPLTEQGFRQAARLAAHFPIFLHPQSADPRRRPACFCRIVPVRYEWLCPNLTRSTPACAKACGTAMCLSVCPWNIRRAPATNTTMFTPAEKVTPCLRSVSGEVCAAPCSSLAKEP